MAMFEVTGANASGKTVKVIVDSDSARGARTKARSQGVTPISVVATDGASINSQKPANVGEAIKNPLGGIKASEISNMTRQLATLIKAHVPIVESLSALIEQIDHPRLKKILSNIKQQVNEGRSLADGFSNFPKVFDRVYINMVRAGESAGRLDVVLLRLADIQENQVRLKNKVMGALTYPIIMVVVAFVVLGVIFIKVIPQITEIFKDMKQTLPTSTVILIGMSKFAQEYLLQSVAVMLVLGILAERYISTAAGRLKKDRTLLKMPLVSTLFRYLAVARFSRTLGTLLSSGVPMLGALQITKNVVGNAVFEDLMDQTGTMVSEGRSLAYAIKQSRQFPPIVVHMIGVGEKTGELEQMLTNVADNYEHQIDNILETLTRTLEPVMMIVMAVAVGAIVMAVLQPIFELNNFG